VKLSAILDSLVFNVRLFAFLLALPLAATPTYTSTTSISLTCQWIDVDQPPEGSPFLISADPGSGCQFPYGGTSVGGNVSGPLSVSGGIGFPIIGNATFDFSSHGTDTAPAGSVISLTWLWVSSTDLAFAESDANLVIDGQVVWSGRHADRAFPYGAVNTENVGSFECAADCTCTAGVEAKGSGHGGAAAGSTLLVSVIDPPANIPEPGTALLIALALCGILARKR